MKIVGVIPARIGSTRLPEKVLASIHGKPMIEHVWACVKQAKKLNEVIVACDDARIVRVIESAGGRAVLTDPNHPNGSSRVAEVARKFGGEVLINIQGDEPTIRPESIDQLADIFLKEPETQVATLAVRGEDPEEFSNPNVVKVVCDARGQALYFSRSPIPLYRDGGKISYLKHLGIYGYQKDFLLKYVTWPSGKLECIEKLEQLRILENGVSIRVAETSHDSWSVDTAEDLSKVEAVLQRLSGTKTK